MFVSCWSVKGGAGTTVVAAALALVSAETSPNGSLLVDLGGDCPAVLGLPESDGDGISEWLVAGEDVPGDALGRLEVPAGSGVAVIRRGHAPVTGDQVGRAEVLASLLAVDPRPVVIDCGVLRTPAGPADEVARALALAATHSWLVTRACYLALRRAVTAPLAPSGVVLVREPGRSLRARDIEDILQVPVVVQIACESSVARAVDAGLLAGRLPRVLEQAVRLAA